MVSWGRRDKRLGISRRSSSFSFSLAGALTTSEINFRSRSELSAPGVPGNQSGNFSCLMAPAGPWELAFLFWRRDLFFARKRGFCGEGGGSRFLWCFCAFFGDVAFWGVFSRYATIISRAARKFFFFFPRGREQNLKFQLCREFKAWHWA